MITDRWFQINFGIITPSASIKWTLQQEVNTVTPDWSGRQNSAHKSYDWVPTLTPRQAGVWYILRLSLPLSPPSLPPHPPTMSYRHLCHLNNLPLFIHAPPHPHPPVNEANVCQRKPWWQHHEWSRAWKDIKQFTYSGVFNLHKYSLTPFEGNKLEVLKKLLR